MPMWTLNRELRHFQGSLGREETGQWPWWTEQRSLTHRLLGLYGQSVLHRAVNAPHQGMRPRTRREQLRTEEGPGCATATLSVLVHPALAGLTRGHQGAGAPSKG